MYPPALLHPLFAFFLFFAQLHFASNVTAVHMLSNVLAERREGA